MPTYGITERADLTNIALSPTAAGGSNIIHPTFAGDIIKSAVESSVAMRTFPVRRVPTGVLSIPVMTGFPQAYWVAETPLYNDTAANVAPTKKPTTEVTWKGVVLKLAELATIVPIPLAVLEDAAGGGTDLWAEIRPYVGQAIGMKIDEAVFFGGTGAHTQPAAWASGLVTQAIAATNTAAAGTDIITAANTVLGKVEDTGHDPDIWFGSAKFRGKLRGTVGSDGHPVYLTSFRSGNAADELYGIPIDYTNPGTGGNWDASVALALTGDTSCAIMGFSSDGMRMDMLREATLDLSNDLSGGTAMVNLAQQNLVALRVSFRAAFATVTPVTVKGTGATPWAVITP